VTLSAKRYHLPLFIWVLIMITVTSIPGDSLPENSNLFKFDKLIHSAEYLLLALLLFRWIRFTRHVLPFKALVYTAGIGILFGIIDELHQLFIPLRLCSWQDMVADSLGVIAGALLAVSIDKKKAGSW